MMPKSVRLVIAISLAGFFACTKTTTEPTSVASLSVAPDTIRLNPGDSVTLSVTPVDGGGHLVSGIAIGFTSGDTSIVHVSNVGIVKAGHTGTTAVTVSGGGAQRIVPAYVTALAASVEIAPTDTTVRQGAGFPLRVQVFDNTHTVIPSAPVAFSSTNTAIANVSGSGLVTTSGIGTATLTATSGLAVGHSTVTTQDSNIVAVIPLANAPYGVAASSAGVVYVSPIIGPAVRRVNMSTFTLTDAASVNGNPAQVAFSPSGDTAYVTKRAAGSIAIISVATHTQVDSVVVPGDPYPIRLSSNGATAYSSTGSTGWLYKIDLATRARTDSVAVPVPAWHLAPGKGDSLLYVSARSEDSVFEVRTSDMTVTRTFAAGSSPQALAVSPDGSELYVADEGGPLRILSIATGTQTDTIPTGGGTFGVALSSDGSKLYVTTTAGKVIVANRGTRAILHTVIVGGTPRLVAVDPVTGYAVVANEGANTIDIVR